MNKETKEKIITLEGKKYTKEKFLIEDQHPAIGRILVIGDAKFKVLSDGPEMKGHRTGTFIAPFTEKDQEKIDEYDEALEELSSKLIKNVDVKRLIKEQIKDKNILEIKTGLFILKAKEDGAKIEEEHHRGCYQYKIHYQGQMFELMTGTDMLYGGEIIS